MSITHIVQCDALLADGHRCEIKTACPSLHTLPREWMTVQGARKRDASENVFLKSMQPLLQVAREVKMKPEDREAGETTVRALEQMVDQTVEREMELPIMTIAHLCPKHAGDLPKIQATDYSGCVY